MSSRCAIGEELGLGAAGFVDVEGDDIEGFFGSILGVAKSIVKPAATFVGGAVGSIVAPGVGTAIGAKVGSFVGGALAGGGGGGGAAPAVARATGPVIAVRRLPRETAAARSRPSGYIDPRVAAASIAAKRARNARMNAVAKTAGKLTTGQKVAIGAGSAGALGLLAWLVLV